MFARGFKEPLSHPTKGRIRHNILEWTSLGFTSRAWSPIKQMLEEERFLLCASCTNVSSYQEWRQRVDMAFEILKTPIDQWWGEYNAWIQHV